MGVVYEAFDRERGHRVALKTLELAGGDALYRFKLEFRMIAELSHPNLVSLYDLFVEGGAAFFTMELIDGPDFVTWCRSPSAAEDPGSETHGGWDQPTAAIGDDRTIVHSLRFDDARLRAALPQLLHGLEALHASGRVHRDIKASNVLVDTAGRVVILDFGLVTGDGTGGHSRNQIVGTLEYMAPEQAHPVAPVTPAADIYSAGVMLYETMVGVTPFAGSPADILAAKRRQTPMSPRRHVPEIPEDLDRLCQAMTSRDPSQRPRAARLLRMLGAESEPRGRSSGVHRIGVADPTFFGRAAELATLDTVFARVRAGEPQIVRLRGKSGIGKTELYREFVRRQQQQHAAITALHGRCFERESLRYRGIDPLVDDLSRTWNELPPELANAMVPQFGAALLRLFPVLARVSALAGAEAHVAILDPQELRRRAFDGLREVLARLAAHRPLVAFLDDMQWVDRDTVLLLADVMRMPGAPPLMLVLADRDDTSIPLNPLLATLFEASSTEITTIPIEPLSKIESIELAQRLLEPHYRELARLVARESTGHPLFLAELAAFVNEGGDDRGDSLHAIRLNDVIGLRLDGLSPECRAIMNTITVTGEPIEQAVIRVALQLDSEPFRRDLKLLHAHRLVRSGGARADVLIEPYHDRIREVALARLNRQESLELHQCVALALEQVGEAKAHGRLARHWLAAGNEERARAYALSAAREAFDQLDFELAAELYELVVTIGGLPEREIRGIRAVIGAALSNAGRPRDAAEAFREAAEGEDPVTGLDLQRRAAEQLLRGGYYEDGLAAFASILEQIGSSMPGGRRRELAAVLWLRARLRLRGAGYTLRDERKISAAELATVDVCWSIGTGLAPLVPVLGTVFHLRGLLAALELGERKRLGRAMAFHSMLASAECDPVALKRLSLAREIGEDSSYVAAYTMMAELAERYFLGCDWPRVLERFEELRLVLTSQFASAGWELDTARNYASFALMMMGELRELARTTREIVQEAGRRRARFASQSIRARLALVWLLEDDPDSAAADLVELAEELPEKVCGYTVLHCWALQSRCEIALYRGDAAQAERELSGEWARMRGAMFLRLPMLALELHYLRARVALVQRDVRSARAHGSRLARVPLRLAQPMAGLVRAGVAASSDDPTAAEHHLRAAIAALDETQTGLYSVPARYRLGQMIGGAEGEQLRRDAEEHLRDQAVVAPHRLIDMLLPGFPAAE